MIPSSDILFAVGAFYPDNSGGPSLTMYWLAKELYKNGKAVAVITTDKGIKGKVTTNSWNTSDFGSVKYVAVDDHRISLRFIVNGIRAIAKAKSIYLASFFYPPSFIFAIVGTILGKQVIWGPRGEASEHALRYSSFKKSILLKLIRTFHSRILFHATSMQEEKDIRKLFDSPYVVNIPIGIEVDESITIDPSAHKSNFIFLGRIHPIKGLENLIEAVARVDEFVHSDCKLLIAGYGEKAYLQSLKNKCTELKIDHKVEFLGKIESHEKFQFLMNGKFLVLPSYSENFGAVIAESLAVGTPVIVSNNTPWEIVAEKKAGFFIDNSVTGLMNVIRQVFSLSKDQFNAMQFNAREIVIQHLDIRQNVKLWLEIIRTC